jgi:hypothetical protein
MQNAECKMQKGTVTMRSGPVNAATTITPAPLCTVCFLHFEFCILHFR